MADAPSGSTPQRDNRRHHKVSIALLGRFTEDGSDEGFLHVLDLSTGVWRRSKPKAEAAERGYYSIDLDGVSPGVIEDFLATDVEGPVGSTLRALAKTQGQPAGPETGALVRYLGMQFLRTEPFRQAVLKFDRGLAKRVIRQMSTRKAFDEYERAHGVKFSRKVREALRSAKFERVGTSRAAYVMMESYHQLLNDLARLHWRVVTLPIGVPNFICSDVPAKFVHDDGSGRLKPMMGGWSRDDIGALMPLSPRQILLGSTDLLEPIFDWKIEDVAVGEFNRAIATGARWVYSREAIAEGIILASPYPRKQRK